MHHPVPADHHLRRSPRATWTGRKFADIDILWNGDLPPAYPSAGQAGVWTPQWRWEGYIASFSWDPCLTIECVGAMRQLDNYLAKPEYPTRPLPYEWAIARQFLHKPALRLQPLRIVWPDWWTTTYKPPTKKTAPT